MSSPALTVSLQWCTKSAGPNQPGGVRFWLAVLTITPQYRRATLERTFNSNCPHLRQGSAALNRKIIEIAHRNVSSGFDLARRLATAKNIAEVVELRAIYWRKQLSILAAQAEEMRELSAKLAADMAAPIKAHVSRSMEKLREELTPKR